MVKAILQLGWLFYNEDYYKDYEEDDNDKYLDIVTILSRKNR
jgi:hypothetical protein